MSLLIFGSSGQVGTELRGLVPGAGFLDRAAVDLADPGACAAGIRARRPVAVINAAAWTAVDRAEAEPEAAMVINAAAPGAMAQACADLGIPLVQISTDYVFDGSGSSGFPPDHPPAPLGVYGRSKLAGEIAVRAAGGCHAILRTSWVFSAHGNNFLKTMLRLGAARPRLGVVADQIGGPTPARAVAEACLTIATALQGDPGHSGTYHLSGAPDVSWAGFAREIMAQAGLACIIDEITTADYPTPAQRPANSRLDCAGLERFGLSRPDWRAGVAGALRELGRGGH